MVSNHSSSPQVYHAPLHPTFFSCTLGNMWYPRWVFTDGFLSAPFQTWTNTTSVLDGLVGLGSPSPTISTRYLAQPPDQHPQVEDRTPNLMPAKSLALQAAGLPRPSHWSGQV
ncbi:hypothetical protein CEXT_241611 [Caerostris extrusa]|uniref:Uncharacterized protein n=1 Tax=Caerostris extrusa TaxID=172846 RepID=A0AAV4P741_CAEEX|nr:hypothetical protein CEXT_241611 [Caerostris extrusa]